MDIVLVAVVGMIFGSFAGAQVWRLRARQLAEDAAAGEKVDRREEAALKPLLRDSARQDRSRCLACHHQLAWYDLIPLVSWVSTGGRCRYCRAPIGYFEPLMEIGYGVFFVFSYLSFLPELGTPTGAVRLIIWLAAGVAMGILAAYDMKWFLLPEKLNFALIALGSLYAAVALVSRSADATELLSLGGALMVMSGLYLLLFIISRGQWIGFGDIILGAGLALFLLTWQQAFAALFLANALGLIAVVPGAIRGKVDRKTHIPFGPFLILGATLMMLWGEEILRLTEGVLMRATSLFVATLML